MVFNLITIPTNYFLSKIIFYLIIFLYYTKFIFFIFILSPYTPIAEMSKIFSFQFFYSCKFRNTKNSRVIFL